MIFFTTFSRANWEEYARYTIPTWRKLGAKVALYWDGSDCPESLAEFLLANKEWVQLRMLPDQALAFQRDMAPERALECMKTGKYRYRRDIRKFAWPVFCWAQALRDFGSQALVWLDADVAVKAPVPLRVVFPDAQSEITYLGRTHHPQEYPYTESGLIGWHFRENAAAIVFADRLADFLVSGRIYGYPQWHDCVVFDELRKESMGIFFKSISRRPEVDHVFDDTLAEYLWHYRGPLRKREAYELDGFNPEAHEQMK